MSILNYNDKDILLERYFGSNKKEFQVIEEELRKIISYVKKSGKKLDIKKLNSGSETEKIKNEFKKLFNLEKFEFFWLFSNIPNAFCFVNYSNIYSKEILNGYDSVDGKGISAYISASIGFINSANLNEKEILAVLLHELGHVLYLSKASLLLKVVSAFLNKKVLDFALELFFKLDQVRFNVIKYVTEFLSKISLFRKLVFDVEQYLYRLTLISKRLIPSTTKVKIDMLKSDPKKIITNFLLTGSFIYIDEKNADAFSADFGYGQYLISALRKSNNIPGLNLDDAAKKSVFIDILLSFKELENTFLSIFFDLYPSDQNRIRGIVDRLKSSLEDPDIPKELKKQLLEDIKNVEKAYESYMNLGDDKRKTLTSIVRTFIDTSFAGKLDIRELVYKIDDIRNS